MTTIDRIGIQPSSVDTRYKAVDPTTQMSNLDVICNHCTVYDSKSNIKEKIFFRYDSRNERFICERCRRVVGAEQVRTALNLNQEEYIHYEKETPAREIIRRRQEEETYAIRANNPVPLGHPSRKPRAIVLNNKEKKNNDNDGNNRIF